MHAIFLYLYNVFHQQLLRIQKDIRNEMSLEYYDTEKHIDDHIQCIHPHLHNFLAVLEHILLHNYIQNFRSNWNRFHCHKCWTCWDIHYRPHIFYQIYLTCILLDIHICKLNENKTQNKIRLKISQVINFTVPVVTDMIHQYWYIFHHRKYLDQASSTH